ncbi:hypothetical protein KM043_001598 [Ampulex compressa]|nr:hypothetical protein KM043_001598 [Ampulex compressa]
MDRRCFGRSKKKALSQGRATCSQQEAEEDEESIVFDIGPSTSRRGAASQPARDNAPAGVSRGQKLRRSVTIDDSQEDTQLVGDVIRYLFAIDRTKQTIHRMHILKNVLNNQSKNYKQIMARVKNVLSKVFGYTLLELEGNKYILANEIENDIPHLVLSRNEYARQVLLFLILTHIFMRGGSCSEDILWNFLNNLGILNEGTHCHEYFQDVKQAVTTIFVSQQYLEKVVIENSDRPQVEYKWGIRAKHEFSERKALEFVSQVYGGRPMKSWLLQYKTVTAKEN